MIGTTLALRGWGSFGEAVHDHLYLWGCCVSNRRSSPWVEQEHNVRKGYDFWTIPTSIMGKLHQLTKSSVFSFFNVDGTTTVLMIISDWHVFGYRVSYKINVLILVFRANYSLIQSFSSEVICYIKINITYIKGCSKVKWTWFKLVWTWTILSSDNITYNAIIITNINFESNDLIRFKLAKLSE